VRRILRTCVETTYCLFCEAVDVFLLFSKVYIFGVLGKPVILMHGLAATSGVSCFGILEGVLEWCWWDGWVDLNKNTPSLAFRVLWLRGRFLDGWMDRWIDGMVVAGIAFCFMELRQRILYDLETI